jgi:hypothetical protein
MSTPDADNGERQNPRLELNSAWGERRSDEALHRDTRVMDQTKQGGATPRDEIERFMAAVVPWPANNEPGYINLHYTYADRNGMGGRAYTNLSDLIGMAQRASTRPNIKDVYFCLTRQSAATPEKDGKLKAFRRKENATHAKALWIDADVKPDQPEKNYTSTDTLLTALQKFLADADLPAPSALVASGSGGLHIYWISNKALTIKEWRPYADGLRALITKHGFKCDAGLTTDSARVLRVPGTFNRKRDPARPVVLKALGRDYNFANELAHVAAKSPVTGPTVTKALVPEVDAQFLAPAASAFGVADPEDSNAGGLNVRDDRPLDVADVLRGCEHFADLATNRGKGVSQGLWMLDMLSCTFLEEGRRLAHCFSKGYPAYTKEETDAMYDRKVKDRAERGLGWPGCAAFENEGCELCTTCAYKGKIKSPLNLALQTAPPRPDSIVEQIKEGTMLPVEAILALKKQGADQETLFAALNKTYAVVRYNSEVLIASITDHDILVMKSEDFHKMFGNVRFLEGNQSVEVSRLWLKWDGRRQYLGRGVVFEPGGQLDTANDMLNLWRGFGVEPTQGRWSLLRNHILSVVCSEQTKHFEYLIRWMAYAVQHPNEPIGVAVAFRGAQGAGKGIVARTFGKIFGKHFSHIANGDQLTGRFNASLATSCAVFLDEALWAGDKKGEGVLKALITEPRLQLEAKFRDPIMVDNRLRIMVASNNDWMVPAGIGDRRWFVLDVADTYAGTEHQDYWDALYAEIVNGGAGAMFYDLLALDLNGFNVRAVPHTAAKAEQQAHSLTGTKAWLYNILQEAQIGGQAWQETGIDVNTDDAYRCYEEFSKRQRDYRPDTKSVWSKNIRKALGPCLGDTRTGKQRDRVFKLVALADCRRRFANHIGAVNIEWEPQTDTQHGRVAPVTPRGDRLGQPPEMDMLPTAAGAGWAPIGQPDGEPRKACSTSGAT